MLKIIHDDGRWILLDEEDDVIASNSDYRSICNLLLVEQAKRRMLVSA